MPTGIEIVRAIEDEIGFELKEMSLSSIYSSGLSGYHLNDDKQLKCLAITSSRVEQIPTAICQAKHLCYLSLHNNQIKNIEPIANIRTLETLILGKNQLENIKPIENLQALKFLWLNQNKIDDTGPIGNLESLKNLWLNDNQIKDIDPITCLNALTKLYLNNNKIVNIKSIANLKALKLLWLNENEVNNIEAIAKLRALCELHLGQNQISDINPIAKLYTLKELYLHENKIHDINPIANLKAITRLSLFNNKIIDINSLLKSNKLFWLAVQNNQIQTLPASFAAFKRRCEVHLDDNPLVFPPPEIIDQGPDALDAFYRQAGPTTKLNEVKVLLVGEGGSGKTSLVKRLLNVPHNPNEDTTHGIRIQDWDCACDGTDFRVRLWDFGGQEIYHATHQFFLSERCVYVIVLDGRRDERVEYWLRHAQNFGGDAPVLVVMNKIDQNPGFELNRNDLMTRYPQIKGFFRTSCSKDQGIAPFIHALQAEIPRVPLHAITWPSSWLKVKQAMEASAKPYLDREAFMQLCSNHGVSENETSQVLIQLLHDLGVAIHFDQFELDEMFVLDPLWVTAAIYRIVRSETVSQQGGVLDLKDGLHACLAEPNPSVTCDQITFEFPRQLQPYLIKLMEKFELCYRLPHHDQVLLPNLLPENEKPLSFNDKDPLRYRIEYSFLPPTLMPSLMVQRHEDIDGELRWRSGVVFINETKDTRAVVRAYKEDRVISIKVYGQHKQQWLTSLRETISKIHKRFQRNTIKSFIACPCKACAQNLVPAFHDLDLLLGRALKEHQEIICQTSYDNVFLRDILDGLDMNLAPALLDLKASLAAKADRQDQPSLLEDMKDAVSFKLAAFGFEIDAAKMLAIWHKRRR